MTDRRKARSTREEVRAYWANVIADVEQNWVPPVETELGCLLAHFAVSKEAMLALQAVHALHYAVTGGRAPSIYAPIHDWDVAATKEGVLRKLRQVAEMAERNVWTLADIAD